MSFTDFEDDVAGEAETGDEESGGGDPNVVSYSPASTCIANLTYHRDTEELFMTFVSGGRYVIEGFPEIELDRWVNSASVGGYFNAFVKGNY